MDILRWSLFLPVWVLLISCIYVSPEEKILPTQKIRSKDKDLQDEGRQEILKERAKLIDDLKAIIMDKKAQENNRSSVITAFNLLGEIRAYEAVDFLAEYIDFVADPYAMPDRPPSIEDWPAAYALAEIGLPSIPAIIRVIGQKGGDGEKGGWLLFVACNIFQKIFGWDEKMYKKVGKLYVEEALLREEDPIIRKNLEEFLSRYF